MGYMVGSLATVLTDSAHGLFLTFLPTRARFQYEWVNDWVYDRFSQLAKRLGSQAVFIAPSNKVKYRDLAESLAPHFVNRSEILHTDFPFLIITKSPLRSNLPAEELAVVVNLAACADAHELAQIFDEIIKATQHIPADLATLTLPVPQRVADGWASIAATDALELKPNFFGVGVNLNAVAKRWAERRSWLARRRQLFVRPK